MKYFVVASTLLFTGLALAEPEFTVKVDRIEMSVTAPEESDIKTDKTDATTDTKAQGYNSSRSNRTVLKASPASIDYNSSRSNNSSAIDPDDDGDGIDTEACTNGVDNNCNAPGDSKPADKNSARTR